MSKVNWLHLLGWTEEQLEDIRQVGYTYIQQGIYDVALDFFEALCILDAPSSYDLQTLGALHLQTGNGLKALELLDRALQLDPQNLSVQLNRVKALLSLGYKKQALQQAKALQNCEEPSIASQAAALLLTQHPA